MQANSGEDHTPALVGDESQSGRHFEEPLPVVSYTCGRQDGFYLSRSQSLDDDQLRDYSLSDITEVLDGPATKEEPAQSISRHNPSDI